MGPFGSVPFGTLAFDGIPVSSTPVPPDPITTQWGWRRRRREEIAEDDRDVAEIAAMALERLKMLQ